MADDARMTNAECNNNTKLAYLSMAKKMHYSEGEKIVEGEAKQTGEHTEEGDDECLDGGMQLLEEFATIDFHNTIHAAKMLRMAEKTQDYSWQVEREANKPSMQGCQSSKRFSKAWP